MTESIIKDLIYTALIGAMVYSISTYISPVVLQDKVIREVHKHGQSIDVYLGNDRTGIRFEAVHDSIIKKLENLSAGDTIDVRCTDNIFLGLRGKDVQNVRMIH